MRHAISLTCLIAGAFAAAPRHIVLVLSDDLGTYAPSYNNPDLQTPMLAELAQTGAVLTAFYAYKYCSPSRASFLTGRYPFKTECVVRHSISTFCEEKSKTYKIASALSSSNFSGTVCVQVCPQQLNSVQPRRWSQPELHDASCET
jgi:hypothetical protein